MQTGKVNIFFINPPLRPSKEGNNGIHFSGLQYLVIIMPVKTLDKFLSMFLSYVRERPE